MDTFPERDWKVFRELRALALERYCAGVVENVRRALAQRGASARQRYLAVHDTLRRHDPEIARAFDDARRSTAYLHLLVICQLGLLGPDELGRFTEETRAWLEKSLADVRQRG